METYFELFDDWLLVVASTIHLEIQTRKFTLQNGPTMFNLDGVLYGNVTPMGDLDPTI